MSRRVTYLDFVISEALRGLGAIFSTVVSCVVELNLLFNWPVYKY